MQPEPDADGTRARRRLRRSSQNISGSASGYIPMRIRAQLPAVSSNGDDFNSRAIGKFGFDDIAGAAQRQSEHVKTWPKIGNSSGCEDPDTGSHAKVPQIISAKWAWQAGGPKKLITVLQPRATKRDGRDRRRAEKLITMHSRLMIGLLGIAIAGGPLSAQVSQPANGAMNAAKAVSGRSANLQSMITGTVIDQTALPLLDAPVQLRNLETKRIDRTTTTNHAGEFKFSVQPGVTYVVELADAAGRILAVGDVVTVNAGEVIGTQLSVPGRLPALFGFGSHAGAVLAAVSALAPSLPPVSPEK